MLDTTIKQKLQTILTPQTRVTVLTGAGISAESGIPTFRGPEGYWTVGSQEYHPQEMATYRMFQQKPDEVWHWYLYRRSVCRGAGPNPGHLALVDLEQKLGERFTLITQNVDGLHLRAGNSLERTYQIHGNVDYMRCDAACTLDIYAISNTIPPKTKTDTLTEADRAALRCPKCRGRTRPHVLWFDEFYNENYYRYQSALQTAEETDVLIVVGTSGKTSLPYQVAVKVVLRRNLMIDINLEKNIFSEMALRNDGYFIQAPSGEVLPGLVAVFD